MLYCIYGFCGLMFALIIVWLTIMAIKDSIQEKRLAKEIHTYQGYVTAINESRVFLNSEPKQIYILGDIRLQIGKKYKIIVDGNGKLINAIILG